MEDGLYFFGQWVADVEVALSKQANDLTNPAQMQATYANLFTIPDTTALRTLLQNAEQLDAGGPDPYRLIPAKLVDDGETVFSGNATLLTFQGAWKVSLTAAVKGLFDQLADLKLGDLDLTRYNHLWAVDTINTFANATDGIVYPAVDYGSITNGVFAEDTLCPAIYAKTLVSVMLQKCGYRAIGDWLNDPEYNRIILPFVEEEPQAHDADWQQARMARVTVTGVFPIPPFSTFDGILQFNRDNEPLNNWVDGKQNNFKADSVRYVCDVAMRLHVTAYQEYFLQIDFGGVEGILMVLKNGQNVVQLREAHSGPYNMTGAAQEQLRLDEYIDCLANDEIQIRFVLQKFTTLAQFQHIGYISDATTWASFEPDTTVRKGDTWPVAENLPDMTCADLLKTIALKCSATFDVDDVAKTIRLRTLDSVIANEANATDLSHCIEESVEPENSAVISPYGQKNLLKWKEQEDKTLIGYGDGVITCNAQNIPLETPLFELPFSAVVDSKNTIPGYGSPPLIQTRVITGSGASVDVQRKAAQPCLLLVEPTKAVTVTVNVVAPDLSVVPTPVSLMGCWWHTRPSGVTTSTNSFSLAFDRPPGTTSGEQTQIQRYFGSLRRILRRPRQFTPSVVLRPVDLATLDLYAPVRLRRVRAGSIDINDNFFYLNKVNNYVSGQLCTLTLIPY